MKNIFTFLILTAFSIVSFAQVPNANFENWNSNTNNKIDVWSAMGKVTKVTGGQAGAYAVKLETDLTDPNSQQGVLSLSGNFGSGYPYTSKLDTVKIWVKYNIDNADTAIIHVEQQNDTTVVRSGDFFITTGTTGAWVEISIPMLPIDTSVLPQILFVGISNTSFDSPQPASWLIVDNIRGYYKNALQPAFPNYSYENWTSTTVYEPLGWVSSNQIMAQFGIDSISCERTTDAQNGTYAVKAHNVDLFGTILPGGLVSGNNIDAAFSPDMTPTFAVSERYVSLSGYLKFTRKGTDEGSVAVYMFKNGTLVGAGIFTQSTTQTTYKPFEAQIQYDAIFTGIPDSATIFIAPTTDVNNATGVSTIWIDNLQLNKFPLGVVRSGSAASVQAFPNPFHDELNIRISSASALVVLTTMEGREVIHTTITKENSLLETSALARGMYILRVQEGEEMHTLKMVRE